MPTPIRFRKALLGITLSAFVLGAGAVAAQETSSQAQAQSSNQTVPDKAADAWITTKVKSEFAATKGIHATDISVDTSDGVVTLSGTVASTHEKTKAVKVARAVKGVKNVDASGLTVQAAGTTP
jgi:hyperosmotically inducible protein